LCSQVGFSSKLFEWHHSFSRNVMPGHEIADCMKLRFLASQVWFYQPCRYEDSSKFNCLGITHTSMDVSDLVCCPFPFLWEF